MTGIELAAEEVGRARRAAAEAGVAARFVVGDLRDLPDAGPVDGLVSWGNSFGYLTPADTVRSLAGMHRLLRPGGRLVLESMTVAESLLPGGIQPHSEVEFGGIRMARSNRYNARPRAGSRPTTSSPTSRGTVERTRAAHHVHTAAEVVRLLNGAGFGDVRLLGGDGGSAPYELGVAAADRGRDGLASRGRRPSGRHAAARSAPAVRAPGSRSARRRSPRCRASPAARRRRSPPRSGTRSPRSRGRRARPRRRRPRPAGPRRAARRGAPSRSAAPPSAATARRSGARRSRAPPRRARAPART